MRIMTSNIWGDYFENPVEKREDNLLKIYARYEPDVLGLQEATKSWYLSHAFEELSEKYAFVGTECFESNNFVPLLIKKDFKILAKGYEYLEETPDKSKGITWAAIEKDGNKIAVCNTHFWWVEGYENDLIRNKNAQQLANIMKYLRARFECPVFAFGDMNTYVSSDTFTIYRANNIKDLFDMTENKNFDSSEHGDPVLGEDNEYHGRITDERSDRSLDHIILLGDDVSVLKYEVVLDSEALDATDHSPVYVDVEIGR